MPISGSFVIAQPLFCKLANTVGALFDEVRMTMPFDSPGSLTPAQYADVLAYIFSSNSFPAGAKELDKDVAPLQQIKIEAP